MKLKDLHFSVCINRNLIWRLGATPEQIFFFVRQAAEVIDEEKWKKNALAAETDGVMDNWNHPVIVVDKKTGIHASDVLEIVPWPAGKLLILLSGYPDTIPLPPNGDFVEIPYPEAFVWAEGKSEKELGIHRMEDVVPKDNAHPYMPTASVN